MKRLTQTVVTWWVLSLPITAASPAPSLLAAVLPSSRSVQVGMPATAFATIINTSQTTAIGCRLAPLTAVPATFAFQTTDPTTNQVTGQPNTAVDIPAGAAQSFVIAFTPTAPFGSIEVRLSFACDNAGPAPITSGLNTLLLAASATPAPDIVALPGTLNADGIVNIPEPSGVGAFVVAAVNVGAGDTITAVPLAATAGLPITLSLCRTDPMAGDCLGGTGPASSVTTSIGAGETAAFAVFAARTAPVPFDPASNRIFVQFSDSAGGVRGSASVAVRTLAAPSGGPSASAGAAITADGALVYALNREAGTVAIIDTGSDAQIGEVAVGQDPQTLALGTDGRFVYVTTAAPPVLVVIDAAQRTVLSRIPVDAEPYGVVADPRGDLVYVAASALATVDVVHTGLGRVISRIPVDPKPKGLALSADARRLYATHFLTGQVSMIDTDRRAVVATISTGGDSNMAQKIAIHPTNERAYLPHIRSNSANRSLLFDSSVFPLVSAVDLAAQQALPAERTDLSLGPHSVNLPSDLAFSPQGQRLYVVNFGSGDLSVVDLAARRKLTDVDVGDGPRGIVVTPDGARAYVVNSLSDDVSVVDLAALVETKRIPITPSPLTPQLKRGKLVFFTSRDPRLSTQRWMSCGSCHFDGAHDGRTWFFPPRGPRNTTSLRGAGETRPLHWSADRDEVQDFELTIRELQAGTGLIANGAPNPPLGPSNAGRSADLDALAAFVASLQPKMSPFLGVSGALTPAAQRGQAIFNRADTACATCHVPPRFTDSTMTASPFITHDVGTGDGPDEGFGPAFDTPSLRGVWDSAPYLHDGSAGTLLDVLTTRNQGDRHGRTSKLNDAEIQDLIAFLRSL